MKKRKRLKFLVTFLKVMISKRHSVLIFSAAKRSGLLSLCHVCQCIISPMFVLLQFSESRGIALSKKWKRPTWSSCPSGNLFLFIYSGMMIGVKALLWHRRYKRGYLLYTNQNYQNDAILDVELIKTTLFWLLYRRYPVLCHWKVFFAMIDLTLAVFY